MRYERVGLSLFAAITVLIIVLAVATMWLFLTSPVTIANAVSDGDVSPLVRQLADVLLTAFESLLKYL
jgi:hypothetical protein